MSSTSVEPEPEPASERGDVTVALERLKAWRKISGRTGVTVPVPVSFLRDQRQGDPPLARMIRAGRGDVRLGVYLCLILRATDEPYDVRNNPVPASWAEMLCLADPKGKGARRVSSAFRWLVRERLVELAPRVGRPPTVQLLDPAGSGQPFASGFDSGARWVPVPEEIWLRGWIFDLPETSLAVLLVIMDRLYKAKFPQFITRERHESYGLSGDTWTRGIKDLKARGLLRVERVPLGDDLHFERMRNAYWIEGRRLDEYPT